MWRVQAPVGLLAALELIGQAQAPGAAGARDVFNPR